MCGVPSIDHTQNILEFKRLVINVAIAHVTIAHEDDQIKAHKKQQLILLMSGDPSLDHTENILEFKRIVTNVAITHVTIAHEDDLIKAHK